MNGMQGVEIFESDEPNYHRLFARDGWRVAVLNHGDRFLETNPLQLERHLKTDETFVLIEGEAALLVGEKAERLPMQKGKIYNFPRGAWHQIRTQPGAKVLIVENDDTSRENSEYLEVEEC